MDLRFAHMHKQHPHSIVRSFESLPRVIRTLTLCVGQLTVLAREAMKLQQFMQTILSEDVYLREREITLRDGNVCGYTWY